MAKLIVRKQDSPGETPLDEQMWPVQAAILVLGGYLLGCALVFCEPGGPWYRNFVTYFFAIPALVALAIWGIRFVDSRLIRRAIQLAAVLSVIVHLIILLLLFYFGKFEKPPKPVALKTENPQRVDRPTPPRPALENVWFKETVQPPKRDFERPVETKTPEIAQTTPTPRAETKPDEREPAPQPQPVPKPEPTAKPAIERQAVEAPAVPRESDQQSKLTRNMRPNELKPLAPHVENPAASPESKSPALPSAADVAGSKVATPMEVKSPSAEAPESPQVQPTAQLARRTPDAAQPQNNPAATPQLARKTNQPTSVPKTNVAAATDTAQPKETSPDATKPALVSVDKTATPAPEMMRSTNEPTPEASQTAQREPAKRASAQEAVTQPATEAAQLARQTSRANPVTAQTLAIRQDNTIARESPSKISARDGPIEKSVAKVEVKPAEQQPSEQPTPTPSPTATARAETQPSPTPPTDRAAVVQRAVSSQVVRTQVAAAQAQPNANPSNTGSSPSAANVSVNRQASAAPQVAANSSQPSPTAAQQQPTRDPAARQQTAEKFETATPATAQIARAATRSPSPAASAVATSEATPEAAANPAAIAARQTAAEKSTTETSIAAQTAAQPSAAPAPTTPNVAATQAVARAQSAANEPVPQSTTSPSPARTAVASALARPTTADAPQLAATSAETNAQGTPGPAATTVSRQAGASGQISQKVADPSPETPAEVRPETVARQQPGPRADALAQTPTPNPMVERRVINSQPLAASVAAADPSPTRAPTSAEGTPQASETSVARQTNPGAATIASATQQPTATASASSQPARPSVARATPSATPTLDPTAPASASPARATLAAASPASPQAIESPAGAESPRPTERPSTEPARMVLARSLAGSAGIGTDINLDRGLPAPTSPARVASASAKRAESVQNTPAGPALAPSEAPQVARSQAGGATPSSNVAANTPDITAQAGAAQASELTASASASVTRNSSNAAKAEFSAAAGSMDIDTGATQIVSSIGAGRAAGGGQPELNPNTQAKALARRAPGGAPARSITAATVSPDAAAPSGRGGGEPPTIDASATAASVVKTNAGGAQPLSGGPATNAPAGPTAEAARAEMVASAEVGRATPVESAPAAAQAGGGNEKPARNSTGQALVLNSQANVPAATGGPTAGAGPTVAGGGQAAPLEATASAAATRTENGGVPAVGGRSVAAEVGPPAETRSVAAVAAARSAANEVGPAGQPADAGRSPALARASGPAALAASSQAAVPLPGGAPSPAGSTAGGAPAIEASAAGTQVARAAPAGGAPVTGGLASKEDEEVGPVAATTGGDRIASIERGRAATSDSSPGLPQAESGRGSPSRASAARGLPATNQGANVQLAGGPPPGGASASAGAPAGVPVDAAGAALARGAVGAPGQASTVPLGAEAGPVPVDAPAGGPAIAAAGSQKASSEDDGGPLPLTAKNAGAPLARSTRPGLAPGGAIGPVAANIPASAPGGATSARPDMGQLAGDVSAGPTTKTSAASVALAADAPEGPGGLATEVTPDVGVVTRQSQQESQTLAFSPARFLRQRAGGTPSINTTAVIAADAFAQRRAASLRRGDTSGGAIGRPPRATEEAIEMGLFYLSKHQMPDGSWSLINYTVGRPGYDKEQLPQLSSDTAATGLSLLCFFGAGYHHKDDRYQQEVARGLAWLVKNQKADGNLYVAQDEESNKSAQLYSHAIAAIALCEGYGMTQDPELKQAAQKALDFIVAAQHKERGGWRYQPGIGADTSVSGWMVMALKSGQLANLKVPPEAYDKAQKWLATARGPAGQEHLYVYNPYAPNTEAQRHGRQPTRVMTAVGMLTNMYLGANRDHSDMRKGADHLLANLPELGDPRDPQRDTYYWYYATQVMFHMKGEYWKKWNEKLHPLLANTQVKQGPLAGSWDPSGTIPDRWGSYGGRIYVTTMNLLSLEVTYRHLPIYEETAK